MQFKYNDNTNYERNIPYISKWNHVVFDLKGENSTFEHTFKVKNDNVAYLLSNMSSISTLPKTYLTASFTDVETGTDFPHVFIGNKFPRIYPNESRSSYNGIQLNANVFLPKDENMYQWDS